MKHNLYEDRTKTKRRGICRIQRQEDGVEGAG